MNFKNFWQSTLFKGLILGISIFAILLIFLLLIFKLGMLVGFRKAGFSYKWGENYHRNFAGPRGGFFGDSFGKDFIEAYGTFGQIIKIDGSTLIVKGRENVEKIVLVKENTTIKHLRETIKLSDLKVDDYIVVIGEPNDKGQIEAKFIRVMPPPPKKSSRRHFLGR